MKKLICIATISVALLLNGMALFATIGGGDSNNIESTPDRCYQTYGYCTAWGMGFMCTLNKTSEYCYKVASECNKCVSDVEQD